jgi:nicotinic acid phosphoribosyltransferase
VGQQEMAKKGHKLLGVRPDNGDMTQLSQEVCKILEKAGLDNSDNLPAAASTSTKSPESCRRRLQVTKRSKRYLTISTLD